MTDNELLLAISNMLDPIREEIQDIRREIRDLKAEIREKTQDIRTDLQDTNNRVRKIELMQENHILPSLNTIEACYTSTYNRYKDNVETYEAMKQDVAIIKRVIAEHSEKLQKLCS